jgi:integrase
VLSRVPEPRTDEWIVRLLDLAELAEVGAVPKPQRDRLAIPAFTARTGDTFGAEPTRDRPGTEAGVPWATVHTLRHSAATAAFRSGWNAVQVQALLGHHSPSFTLATYVHALPGDLPEPCFADAILKADTETRVEAEATGGTLSDRNEPTSLAALRA